MGRIKADRRVERQALAAADRALAQRTTTSNINCLSIDRMQSGRASTIGNQGRTDDGAGGWGCPAVTMPSRLARAVAGACARCPESIAQIAAAID